MRCLLRSSMTRSLSSRVLSTSTRTTVSLNGDEFRSDGPVALLALEAELVDEMSLEILDDAIVVEQGVVDVDEEDGVAQRRRILPQRACVFGSHGRHHPVRDRHDGNRDRKSTRLN